ncbi:RNA polymerase II transcription factor B 52 kDa subunit [Teratosphaeriaceae sp. CCFEE 6253]|nr:RNA polymerase II transcription factor B 52 kDa subunit [Teratosphaeriaceae sp. CCFEE 6253]
MSSTASQRALDYLEQLPGTTFTKLYQQPSTALAIFRRMLPHLAKTLVMALLYMPTPFAVSSLEMWVKPDAESQQSKERALSILSRLKILYDVRDATNRPAYQLADAFAKSLRMALTGGGDHRSFGVPCQTADKAPVTIDYLDAFARRQWEAILYYVVGSAQAGLGRDAHVSPSTQKLLQIGEFVAVRGTKAHITQAGFTFLLQEVNAQIWTLLIVYLEYAPQLDMDPIDVLAFLFTLGSLELGISYSTANLSPTQARMLEDLADFGIVYARASDTTRYYPTRLATTLTSDAPALPNTTSSTLSTTPTPSTTSASANPDEKGYIILETNYRLYAYTASPLLISILSLFTALRSRYPNLVTAKLTKSSIQAAIQLGITSDQIIAYLTTHAHPLMLKQQAAIHTNNPASHTPILPPTVVDQIRLWQLEGERMASTRGYYIHGLASAEEYGGAVAYAEALGVLKKAFPARQSFFVTRMDQMSAYFKAQAAKRKEVLAKREADLAGGVGVKREG